VKSGNPHLESHTPSDGHINILVRLQGKRGENDTYQIKNQADDARIILVEVEADTLIEQGRGALGSFRSGRHLAS